MEEDKKLQVDGLWVATDAILFEKLDELCSKLNEVTEKQVKVKEALERGNAQMKEVGEMESLREFEKVMEKVPEYNLKAINLRGDMEHLNERIDKLKKRTAKLQQKKEKYDAEFIEKERKLIAVDVSQGTK